MSKTAILQYAGVGSPYRGNFISSLDELRFSLKREGREVVYLFPARTAKREWATELAWEMPVYFLTGNLFKDIFIIRGIIKKHGIGIIHSHFFSQRDLFIINIASLFWGVKKVLHIHCEIPGQSFIKTASKKLLMRNKTVIGCSKLLTEQARALLPQNEVHFISNAVLFERLEQFELLDKKQLGLSETASTLMMFGFLYEVKGVDLALEALDVLNKGGKQIQLILVLSSNEDSIRQKIVERFGEIPHWLHILPPRNDIASYYRLCDLFIAPSRSEGMPYSVLEVASLGIPLLLSDIPAHKNLELPQVRFFESGNSADLSGAVAAALEMSAEERQQLSEQARQVRENYTLPVWTEKIMHIYKELN